MKRKISLLYVIVVAMLWVSWPSYGKIPRRESDALRTLFNTAGGQDWVQKDYWKGRPGTEKDWYGVTCDATDTTVVKLDLRNNNLSGALPADLSDLANLKTLLLSGNQLNALHPDLAKLTQLTTLDLSNNHLSGPLPAWLAELRNLKKLDLGNNRFRGPIPAWLGNLKHLEVLILDANHFRGPVPASLGKLKNLSVLRIGHNGLSGKIPPSLGTLSRLADKRCNFNWNGLYTDNAALTAFLNRKQAGASWTGTQTVPPGKLKAPSSTKTSILLNWSPIAYTTDSGKYRVYYSETRGGPYKVVTETGDKAVTETEITHLRESTTYYFVMDTVTFPHGSNRNRIQSGFSNEFAASTRGTTISGYVRDEEGRGLANVELRASDKGGKAFTDSTGRYDLSVIPGWSGTVTAFKKGYEIFPPLQKYDSVHSDQEEKNYKATAYTTISGRITDARGNPVPDVELTFLDKEGKKTAAVKTGKGGNYAYTVAYNWAGTVTPEKNNCLFEPETREYDGVISAETDRRYTAFRKPRIGGGIKSRSGKGIAGVTLIFSGTGDTPGDSFVLKSDEEGNYLKVLADDWSGTVTAVKPGYTFFPATRRYSGMTWDMARLTENFRGELNFNFFFSLTTNYMMPAHEEFKDVYGSGQMCPYFKAGYKLSRSLYVWGGYGSYSKEGTVPVFGEPTTWKESFYAAGLGYNVSLSAYLDLRAEFGVCRAGYSEQAFGVEVSGGAIGGMLSGAVIFKLNDRVFTGVEMGYIMASDTIEIPNADDVLLKLGGLKMGIVVGVRL